MGIGGFLGLSCDECEGVGLWWLVLDFESSWDWDGVVVFRGEGILGS